MEGYAWAPEGSTAGQELLYSKENQQEGANRATMGRGDDDFPGVQLELPKHAKIPTNLFMCVIELRKDGQR